MVDELKHTTQTGVRRPGSRYEVYDESTIDEPDPDQELKRSTGEGYCYVGSCSETNQNQRRD